MDEEQIRTEILQALIRLLATASADNLRTIYIFALNLI